MGETWGPRPWETAPVTSTEHKECSAGGKLGTMFPEDFASCSPAGSPGTQRDQGQRRLQPELGGTGNALTAHKAYLRGPVQAGRSLMGGEGCGLAGLGREGWETIYRRAQPARYLASQVTSQGRHWDLVIMTCVVSRFLSLPLVKEPRLSGCCDSAEMNTCNSELQRDHRWTSGQGGPRDAG